jgi:hypothetical protein
MIIDLVMTPSRAIVAATPDDAERLKSVRPGDLLPVDIRKVRDGDHHRRFMALVQFVADNHPHYERTEDVVRYLKYATHHVHETITAHGEILYELRSISWRSMDEGEFIEWSAKARAIVYDELLPQFTDDDKRRLSAEIDKWLAWR